MTAAVSLLMAVEALLMAAVALLMAAVALGRVIFLLITYQFIGAPNLLSLKSDADKKRKNPQVS